MAFVLEVNGANSIGGISKEIDCDNKKTKCFPGLRIIDQNDLNTARCHGWFLSYDAIVNAGEDFTLDYARIEAFDSAIMRMTSRYFIANAKRGKKTVSQLSDQQKKTD